MDSEFTVINSMILNKIIMRSPSPFEGGLRGMMQGDVLNNKKTPDESSPGVIYCCL
jgi:hypothetical protein